MNTRRVPVGILKSSPARYLGLRYPKRAAWRQTPSPACSSTKNWHGPGGLLHGYHHEHAHGDLLPIAGSEDIVGLMVPYRGEKIGVICFTEDQSGSDGRHAHHGQADGDGNQWRQNWITNGPIATSAPHLPDRSQQGRQGSRLLLIERAWRASPPGLAQDGCVGSHHRRTDLRQCVCPRTIPG